MGYRVETTTRLTIRPDNPPRQPVRASPDQKMPSHLAQNFSVAAEGRPEKSEFIHNNQIRK